jgi:hypothetical protein
MELMSREEVAALHANFTRARELQTAPAGEVATIGACACASRTRWLRARRPGERHKRAGCST